MTILPTLLLLLAAPQDTGALAAPAAQEGPTLLAVDAEGRPLAGLRFEPVLTLAGALEPGPPPPVLTTGPDGRVTLPLDAEGLAPLDLRLAPSETADHALRFLHARRETLDEAGADALGRMVTTLAADGEHVAVIVPTGVLSIEVPGAAANDRFVCTFMDERPEPALHRRVRVSAEFTGPSAALHFPPGRGTLHIAREGALGGLVQDADGPLNVAIRSNATTSLRIGFTEGPVALMLAPFESIPFDTVENLSPDGRIVVTTYPFDASPLKMPSLLPHVAGLEIDARRLAVGTRFKEPLRASGVPLVREQPESYDADAPRGLRLADAPIALLLAMGVGEKLRLPEVEGGWMPLASAGLASIGGIWWGDSMATRGAFAIPGHLDLGTGDAAPAVDLVWADADGAPAAHRELVVGSNAGTARALTDAEGRLRVSGAGMGPLHVASIDDVTRSVVATPNGGPGPHQIPAGPAPGRLTGTLVGAAPGTPLVLVLDAKRPAPHLGAADLQRLGTAGLFVAITDARGRFDFGAVPAGAASVRRFRRGPSGAQELGSVDVPAGEHLRVTVRTEDDGSTRIETAPGD